MVHQHNTKLQFEMHWFKSLKKVFIIPKMGLYISFWNFHSINLFVGLYYMLGVLTERIYFKLLKAPDILYCK